MMQKRSEVDKVSLDLNAKEQQKTQFESQCDERSAHVQRITVQIQENEQKLKENENNIAQTVQARHEREADKQVNEHEILLKVDSKLYSNF